ncbi:MAG: hypothetical protein AAGA32_12845 [Pseudomonadota bacterium]
MGDGAQFREDVWAQAEASQAVALARLCTAFGALDERLRRAPDGWRHRLALLEASHLSWRAGDRVAVDRLALWAAARQGGAGTDTLALQRADWARRRLSAGPGPADDLETFLGRPADGRREPPPESDLHPVTVAARLHLQWLGDGALLETEASVAAARHAARAGGRGALFLPLAGGPGLVPHRPAPWYKAWIEAADAATHAALAELERLELWEEAAADAMSSMSGRTPRALRRAFASWPMLSVQVAASDTRASRDAIRRNIEIMAALGLVREITGQRRYRVWQAHLSGRAPHK